MGHSYSEEEEQRIQATVDGLTIPTQADLPLRELLIAHITSAVLAYNERSRARIHYLRTGEVTHKDLGYLPAFGQCSASHVQTWVRSMEKGLLELPELANLPDKELLAEYNILLLKLRERLLPDPGPA